MLLQPVPERTHMGGLRWVEVVAHRGDPVTCVENTLEAVESAISSGARIVEVDVRTTADHVPVLLHDETLERIWGDRGRLDRTSSAMVAERRGPRDTRIPTLQQVLELARGRATLMLDLPDARDPDRIVQVAAGHDVVWCGDHNAMAVVRELDPHAVIYLTWQDAEYPSDDLLTRLRPRFVNPSHWVLDPAWLHWAADHDLLVSCWTVDDPVRFDQLRELGVASITSNHSAAMRQHMSVGATGVS